MYSANLLGFPVQCLNRQLLNMSGCWPLLHHQIKVSYLIFPFADSRRVEILLSQWYRCHPMWIEAFGPAHKQFWRHKAADLMPLTLSKGHILLGMNLFDMCVCVLGHGNSNLLKLKGKEKGKKKKKQSMTHRFFLR